jgi:hypothetical protein
MKKYITALLLSIGLMAMQSASAATLSLDNASSTVTLNGNNTGSSTGTGTFDVIITGNSGELVDILFSMTGGGLVFNGGTDPVGISPGTYGVQLFGRNTFTAEIVPSDVGGEIPVPAAVWLFGSALMGLFGVRRRKTTSAIAA